MTFATGQCGIQTWHYALGSTVSLGQTCYGMSLTMWAHWYAEKPYENKCIRLVSANGWDPVGCMCHGWLFGNISFCPDKSQQLNVGKCFQEVNSFLPEKTMNYKHLVPANMTHKYEHIYKQVCIDGAVYIICTACTCLV